MVTHSTRTWVWLIVITATFFALNCLSLHTGDDLGYMFADTTHHCGDGARVTTLSQCFTTQMHHYVTTNGRFTVHVVVMALLNLMPLWAYRLLNSLMFGLLWLLATRFVASERRTNALYATAWLLLFVALPQPGLVLLTLVSYAVNYLWVAVATLAFLLWLQRNPHSRLLIAYALFVGSLQESFSLPLCAGLVVATICRHVPLRVTIAFIAGAAIEVFAPGNFSHAAQGGGFTLDAIANKLSALSTDLCFSIVTYATLAAIIWMMLRRRKCLNFMRENIMLIVSIYAALALAAVTFTSPRQLTAPTLFTIVLLLKLVPSRKWIAIVASCATVAVMVPMAIYKYQIYERYQSLLQSVNEKNSIAYPTGQAPCDVNNTITRAFIPDPLCDRGLVAIGDKYTKNGLRRIYNPNLNTLLPASKTDIIAAARSSKIVGEKASTAHIGAFDVVALPMSLYNGHKFTPAVPFEQFSQADTVYRVLTQHTPFLTVKSSTAEVSTPLSPCRFVTSAK